VPPVPEEHLQVFIPLPPQSSILPVILCTNFVAGSKSKLVERLIRFEKRRGDAAQGDRQLHQLHTPTKTSVARPTINQHYATTFNSVDRFNKLMGRISFNPRCRDVDMRLLTGVVSAAIVQAWVLVTGTIQGEEANELDDLKTAAQHLAAALIE